MEHTNSAWDIAERLPELLSSYADLSYPLLLLIAAAGGLLLELYRRRRAAAPAAQSVPLLVGGGLLVFASGGGVLLKTTSHVSGRWQSEQELEEFLATYRATPEDHWVFVADFLPGTGEPNHEDRMNHLASIVSETLLEEIPSAFPQAKVRRLPLDSSPWSSGVDDDNYEEVMGTLHGDELIWGSMHEETGPRAKAFLAISEEITPRTGEFHGRAPLKDLNFDDDPRVGLQFSDDGHYRLIGMVMLGMALETLKRADATTGESRRLEFMKAVKQLAQMQRTVVNSRDDPILSRTVYGDHVASLLENAQREAGLL